MLGISIQINTALNLTLHLPVAEKVVIDTLVILLFQISVIDNLAIASDNQICILLHQIIIDLRQISRILKVIRMGLKIHPDFLLGRFRQPVKYLKGIPTE